MVKNTKKSGLSSARILPVALLFLLLLGACIYLAGNVSKKDGNQAVSQQTDALSIICPTLSESADCFLLRQREGAVLIDTSVKADSERILQLLEDAQVKKLDALILTHYDKDHIGGAAALLRTIPVKKCYMTCGSEDSEEYNALMEAIDESDVKEIIVTDELSFSLADTSYVIYPPRVYAYEKDNDNNRSLITKVSYHGKELLFTGDAEKERTQEFLEYQYDDTAYDFLKVSHHGRSNKALKELLEHFHPSYALISSSLQEPADDETIEALKQQSVSVWDTKDGTVVFDVTEKEITVRQ